MKKNPIYSTALAKCPRNCGLCDQSGTNVHFPGTSPNCAVLIALAGNRID